MVEYFGMPCPNCRRDLRIRREYAGRFIACSYCHHTFRPTAPAPLVSQLDEAAVRQLEAVRAERDRVQEELQKVRTQLEAEAAQKEQLTQLQTQVAAVQAERDQIRAAWQGEVQQREQLVTQLAELQHALTEAKASQKGAQNRITQELDGVRALLEAERQAHAQQEQ